MLIWLVEGYEGARGPGSIDRERLKRMLLLRKEFYRRFCVKAQEDDRSGEQPIPADMKWFIDYVVRWVSNGRNADVQL
jgi:hypothetical protein